MMHESAASARAWWQVTHDATDAQIRLSVGLGTCGRAAGALKVFDELTKKLIDRDIRPVAVGCRGMCYAEPLVEVSFADGQTFLFGSVDVHAAQGIADTLIQENPLPLIIELFEQMGLHRDNTGQETRVLSNSGIVDPLSLEEYQARGGYLALQKSLATINPSAIIELIKESGLRGRGGAGFPTGRKWEVCADNNESERFFIVNADEGDPGAYMDRALLESDPHKVLEGLIIACYAIGAKQAYFFIRAEYRLAVTTVKKAIESARQAGFIGKNILGSGWSLEITVVRGAGAFLCGEGSAMVNVLENKLCTPRKRPPHLAEKGLWNKPTCINNVETLANVAMIVEHGASWFRSVGTEKSPGTKIFSVVGSVERGGLIEVSLGLSLGEVTGKIAGAKDPKAVQIGGPSGVILPIKLSDLEVSFEGLDDVGGMIGSGGLVVISQTQCVVDTAFFLIDFSAKQSCKRCKVCRDGLSESVAILKGMTAGQGSEDDIEKLKYWANLSKTQAFCGLGRTAFNPITSSLMFFADEFKAHSEGRCPSLVCRSLVSYEIIFDRCQGERCCLLTCPGNAIRGSYGKPGHIVSRLCQKCGMCVTTCPYSAVKKISPAV